MKAELMEIGTKAKEAAGKMALLETNKKNDIEGYRNLIARLGIRK